MLRGKRGKTILASSCGLKEKSHYNNRFSLNEASTKKEEIPKRDTLRLEKQFTRIENLKTPSIVKKSLSAEILRTAVRGNLINLVLQKLNKFRTSRDLNVPMYIINLLIYKTHHIEWSLKSLLFQA